MLLAFIPMAWLGIPATIMSLGGIAIAVGATVDAEIVMIEACHKALESAPANITSKERRRRLAAAAREVTPAIFFSLLIIAVAFIPVFGLEGQAGRLFKPLAYTKTFVMLSAALLSVTFAPALRDLLIRGKIRSEVNHPISRLIRAVYEPFVYIALRRPITTLAIGVLAVASSIPVWLRLGNEFMPALNEGDILYMPTTLPGLSIEEAKRQLARQDAIIAAVLAGPRRGWPGDEVGWGLLQSATGRGLALAHIHFDGTVETGAEADARLDEPAVHADEEERHDGARMPR